MDKIEDFGVHASAYYPLEVEVYKSKLDTELLHLLWNKYWIGTLSQSLVASVCHLIGGVYSLMKRIVNMLRLKSKIWLPNCRTLVMGSDEEGNSSFVTRLSWQLARRTSRVP